ncbi:hypothetical protein R3P38DRAFT_3173053 [Favolaschia claudopus]|uniref:Uncharacterized protein n=1 Tax=Favolaschia claudopus TaxID=2862362 RepID=A0AAW0DQZ5_9AGAR
MSGENWKAFALLFLACGYSVIHCLLENMLGHAVLAIGQPMTYLATLRSVLDSSLWGGLIINGSFFCLLALLIQIGATDLRDCILHRREYLLVKMVSEILAFWLGVASNTVGVRVLRIHGYLGPLPTSTQAARAGAVGAGVSFVMHLWRLPSEADTETESFPMH